jgi:hypothetical protein
MRAALIVHYLERISDHGVDIGERTIFLVSGERIEDAMQQYLDRNVNYNEGWFPSSNARRSCISATIFRKSVLQAVIISWGSLRRANMR